MLAEVTTASAQANYNDLAGLSQIKQLAQVNEGAAYTEIGKQFESLLMHAMLKNMRSANRVWAEGGLLQSQNVEFYQGMLDEQLSLSLVQGDGLGLAKRFAQDMSGRFSTPASEPGANEQLSGGQSALESRALQSTAALTRKDFGGHRASAYAGVSSMNAALPASVQGAAKIPGVAAHAGYEPANALSRENFVAELLPLAQRAAAELELDPEILLAQAALESGWGEHVIKRKNGESSHNLFGIKAQGGWQGDTAKVVTHEYIGLRKVNVEASFRAYDSFAESFADYVAFINSNGRYAEARAHHKVPESYPTLLQQAGYATDPHYASKIHAIAERIDTRSNERVVERIDKRIGERMNEQQAARQVDSVQRIASAAAFAGSRP